MNKRVLSVILSFILVFFIVACKEKEKRQPTSQPPEPVMPGPIQTGPITSEPMPSGQMMPEQMPRGGQEVARPGPMMPRGKTQVVVPDSVKNAWGAARIIIEDKIAKTKQEYTVKLNSDFKIPNSNLRIHVGDFLPDFRMEGLNLTSASNNPNNPALAIRVYEGEKQIFPAPGRSWGWLFAKVPSIHPFEHQKYGIFLKEGLRRG
jgi:hypothetical protein